MLTIFSSILEIIKANSLIVMTLMGLCGSVLCFSKKQWKVNLGLIFFIGAFIYSSHLKSLLPEDFIRPQIGSAAYSFLFIGAFLFMLFRESRALKSLGLFMGMTSLIYLNSTTPLEKKELSTTEIRRAKKDRTLFYFHPVNKTLRVDVYKDAVCLHYNALLADQRPKYFKRRFFPRQGLMLQFLVDKKPVEFTKVELARNGLRCEYNDVILNIEIVQQKFKTRVRFNLENQQDGRQYDVTAWGEMLSDMSVLPKDASYPIRMREKVIYKDAVWAYLGSECSLMFIHGFEDMEVIGRTGLIWGQQIYKTTESISVGKTAELHVDMLPMLTEKLKNGAYKGVPKEEAVLEDAEMASDPDVFFAQGKGELVLKNYWYFKWFFELLERITSYCNSTIPAILTLLGLFQLIALICFYAIMLTLKLFARACKVIGISISYPDEHDLYLWVALKFLIGSIIPISILGSSGIFYNRPVLWLKEAFRLSDDNIFTVIGALSAQITDFMISVGGDLGPQIGSVLLIFMSVATLRATYIRFFCPVRRFFMTFHYKFLILTWNILILTTLYSSIAIIFNLPIPSVETFVVLEYMPIYCCASLYSYFFALPQNALPQQKGGTLDADLAFIGKMFTPILSFIGFNFLALVTGRFSKIGGPLIYLIYTLDLIRQFLIKKVRKH